MDRRENAQYQEEILKGGTNRDLLTDVERFSVPKDEKVQPLMVVKTAEQCLCI